MGHKAKVWRAWLIAIISVTAIRTIYYGGDVEAFFVKLLCNLLFWWFLIMFIYRIFKPGNAPLTPEERFLEAAGSIISDWENITNSMVEMSDEDRAVLKNASPKIFEGKLVIVVANKAIYDQINNETAIMNIQSDLALKSKMEIPIGFAYFDENQQICRTANKTVDE